MSKISRALITVLFAGFFLPATAPVAHATTTTVNCGTSGSYTVNETGVVTTNNNCVGSVTFGSNVVSIEDRSSDGNGVFQNNDSFTSITFGPTVKWIGRYAFKGSSFTSITFSEGLESISAYAFQNFNDTTQLDNVDLDFPDSLRSIGSYAFSQITGTGKTGAVKFGSKLESIGASAFWNTGGSPNFYGPTSITFKSEPTLTDIGADAFNGSRVSEFIAPVNLTNIGVNLLRNNQNLVSLVVPNSVTTIDQRAFAKGSTSAFRTLVLPDGLSTLLTSTNQLEGQPVSLKVIYCGTNSTILTYINTWRQSGCSRATQYSANGGVGSTILETVTADSNKNVAKTLTANTFTRAGYEFDGWNTKRDGSGTKYTDQQVFTQTTHLTLFAQWWDLSKPRPGSDNAAEARRKRQAEIDAARNSLVQKIKAGDVVVNPDFIAADVQQFNAEIAKKANADFQVAAKSKDFGFPDVRKVITKWGIYQDIENGVRSTVTGRTASAAGIIPDGVVQKQLLISRVQKVAPEKRATVEQIDKLIADLAKIDAARKARLALVIARSSRTLSK